MKNPAPRLAVASLVALSLGGCADPPPLFGESPLVPSTTEPPAAKPDLAMESYPEGPYGNQEGDTFFDIDMPGYRLTLDKTDTTAATWEDSITLSSVRAANPNAKCIWVSLGASWCGVCRQEQSMLPAEIAKQDAAAPKIAVYSMLMEGPDNGSNKVTKDDVDAWIADFSQNYPVVMSDGKIHQDIWRGWDDNGVIGLPFNLIIDRKTMAVKGHLRTPTYEAAVQMCDQ